MDDIMSDFIKAQTSVMCEQIRIIRELLSNLELRLEEIEAEADYPDWKIGLDDIDDFDIEDWVCDCALCRDFIDDPSYRMD